MTSQGSGISFLSAPHGALEAGSQDLRPATRKKAGHAFHTEASQELEHWVRGAAAMNPAVAGGMRRGANKRQLPEEKRKPVGTCADHLLDHKRYCL